VAVYGPEITRPGEIFGYQVVGTAFGCIYSAYRPADAEWLYHHLLQSHPKARGVQRATATGMEMHPNTMDWCGRFRLVSASDITNDYAWSRVA
jgi:hypothetical protein